jgi:hypothetical protein
MLGQKIMADRKQRERERQEETRLKIHSRTLHVPPPKVVPLARD